MALFVIIMFLSRREDAAKAPGSLLKPFYRMATYVYKRFCMWKTPLAGSTNVEKALQWLYPGENKKQLCTDYYVKKIALCLMIVFVGTLFAMLVSVKAKMGQALGADGKIARGTYEEGSQELKLSASVEGLEEQSFPVIVEPREYSEEELEVFLLEFRQQLPELIRGENASLQEVSKPLLLEESYAGFPFLVEWWSDQPEVIANTGNVLAVSEQEHTVVLTASLSYGDREWEEQVTLLVVPLELTEEERQYQELEEMVLEAERNSRGDEQWSLPESFRGQGIRWSQQVEDYGILLFGAVLLAAVLVFFLTDKDLQDDLEKRKSSMRRRYPDVVQKLLLYLGAGLTVRASFQKIAGDYEQSRKNGKTQQPIYEEMLYTCHELQVGVSEGAAYEHFGKRTGLQEYIRLSTLLMQNIKKGNNTLLQRLREEADKACIEQLQNSRKLGEEATTKLLLPMVMMLLVVMLMIMLPAFSSVGV